MIAEKVEFYMSQYCSILLIWKSSLILKEIFLHRLNLKLEQDKIGIFP